MAKDNRRKFLGAGLAAGAVAAVTAAPAPARAAEKPEKKVLRTNAKNALFSGTIAYGNLVFISGVGCHQEGDIKVHTKGVLDSIEKQLNEAGSSMEKCLKCSVFLADLKDYDGMNEVFRGRFGAEPHA